MIVFGYEMKANRLVLAGSFCWDKDCPDYGLFDHGNIVKYGRTGKGTQRAYFKIIYAALHHESNFAGHLRPRIVIFACTGFN